MCSRLALVAFVAALFSGSSAIAQQPPQPRQEAELKKAQEQLEKLLKELKDLQEKEAKKAKPETAKVPPPPPLPPTPATPPTPGYFSIPAQPPIAWSAQAAGAGDKTAAIKELLASKDPRTAALARELLEHLLKTAPKPDPDGKAHTLSFELVPSGGGKSGATFEYKVAPPMTEAKPVERRVVVVGDNKGPEGKAVEARVLVVGERMTATAPVGGGASTLKLSADGKTAAVVSADGAVTIYDVATGKEIMKFSGKK